MNKFVKGSLIFLSGVGCGTVAAYYVANKYLKKSFNEELELVREHYRNRFPRLEKADIPVKTEKDKNNIETEPVQHEVHNVEPNVVLRVSNEQYDYTKHSKKKEDNVGQSDSDVDELYHEISSDEAGSDDWDQEYLTYYANSGDLVETLTGDIVSPCDVLGPKAYDILSDRPEEDTFYWQNNVLGIEYEIDCVNDVYISKEIEND